MTSALSRVLLKVVARGFYQEHTGWLSALFLLVFINFFWTRVPNQSHVTQQQLLQHGFGLVLMVVSEPLGIAMLLGTGFVYSLKSWHYVAGRLQDADLQFLAYSSTALPRHRQLQVWSLVQGVILLPLISLCLYAMVIGLRFHHWLVLLWLPIYLLLLTGVGAGYYTRLLNNLMEKPGHVAGLTWGRTWPKPLFSLFLYEISARKRVTYFLTKAASAVSIVLLLLAFPDSRADGRLLGLMGLCCAVGHCLLAFHASAFDVAFAPLLRNLPYGRGGVAGQQVLLYGILLLPEFAALWLVGGASGLLAASYLLSVTLLLRALLYWTGQHMTTYLRLVCGLFLFLLLANLFGITGLLALGSVAAATVLLYNYY